MCGKDLTIIKRTSRLSNSYYNRGLEKAKVRDLTGAILMLKKSLEMNKRNMDARNLLGLVFFEMGETVAALSEWVISKHFQTKDNDADVYINAISDNPTKLDAMNQAIKKYNLALESAKQGSDDLAIIQLKKVVSLNPHFIRAIQLLALLYMKNNEYEKAKRCLIRASKIDFTNTTTLRYTSEINQLISGGAYEAAPYWSDGEAMKSEGNSKAITPISSYKEEKPNVWLFVNLVLGVIIGIAVVFFLIVPTVRSNVKAEYDQNARDFSSDISALNAKYTSAQNDVESLTKKLEDKQAELDSIVIPEYDKEMYTSLITAIYRYTELKAKETLEEDAILEIAKLLAQVDIERMEMKEADSLYELVRTEIYPLAATITYEKGKKAFEASDFELSVQLLSDSYEYEANSDSTIYYLGKAYQELEQYDQARECYNTLLSTFPDSSLVQYTNFRLGEMEGL
jgi:tetratricopeptide (TPR) repeat protein